MLSNCSILFCNFTTRMTHLQQKTSSIAGLVNQSFPVVYLVLFVNSINISGMHLTALNPLNYLTL